jgi:hypothetical protein
LARKWVLDGLRYMKARGRVLFIDERSQVYKGKRDGLCKSRNKIPEGNSWIRTTSCYQGNYPWIAILIIQNLHAEGWRIAVRCKNVPRINLEPTNHCPETVKLSTASLFINLELCSYYRRHLEVNGSFGAYHKKITSSTMEHGVLAIWQQYMSSLIYGLLLLAMDYWFALEVVHLLALVQESSKSLYPSTSTLQYCFYQYG